MRSEVNVSELRQQLLKMGPVLRMAGLLSAVIGLLLFAPTVYMFEVYGRVVYSRDDMTLLMLTLVILCAYALMEWLEFLRSRLLWGAGVRFELALGPRVHQAMFEGLLKNRMMSVSAAYNDLKIVREFFTNPVLGAVFDIPLALLSIVLMFMIHPLLGWAGIAGGFVQTLVAWLAQRLSRKPLMEAQKRSQEAQQFAEASLRNAQVMESMGMLGQVQGRWQRMQASFLAYQAQASEAAGGLTALSKLVQQLMGSVMMGCSAWLLLGNNLPGGASMLIISSVLAGRMLSPLSQIVSQWSPIVSVFAAWNRLESLLQEIVPKPKAMVLPAPAGALSVEGLIGTPPGFQQVVIRGVQFSLSPGEVLAVVGPSASGKTSLAKLLLGIWKPQAGKVRLDGVDIHGWDKDELGPYLGYLPQGVELIDGTLADNITRFGGVDEKKMRDAATLVGLNEFIEDLEQGYKTPVGRDGMVLSGGQRQRVALARAVYGNPVLVVLDEPNSSLDEAGDIALSQTIKTMKSRGTTFVVNTHRTSVLGVSDKMLLLRDGMQQLFGPTAEVLEKLRPHTQSIKPADASSASLSRDQAS